MYLSKNWTLNSLFHFFVGALNSWQYTVMVFGVQVSALLHDLQSKILHIAVAVSLPFKPLDHPVHPLADRCCDPKVPVVPEPFFISYFLNPVKDVLSSTVHGPLIDLTHHNLCHFLISFFKHPMEVFFDDLHFGDLHIVS